MIIITRAVDFQLIVYINTYSFQTNTLHRNRYHSVRCEPCTREILPNKYPRAGR